MIRTRLLALALTCALPWSGALAADAPPLRPSYDLAVDGAVTAAAAGGTLALLLLEGELAPVSCRWCEPGRLDGELARQVGWRDPKLASTFSDVLQVAIGGGVLGYTLVEGHRRGDREAGYANALLITEATSLALLLEQAVKYSVGRSRPQVWLDHAELSSGRDGNLSFFSGHTTFAFAVAASSSTLLLSQHAPGAVALSVLAFSAAGLTGYLRMAAEQHYLMDVLAGAAVGTLVGWAVPHFFHAPREGGLALRPAPGGISIAW
ncbi:MAG TPA: phosphatase PAP2 family protein [Anaeromyxobacteraceae bacterium]